MWDRAVTGMATVSEYEPVITGRVLKTLDSGVWNDREAVSMTKQSRGQKEGVVKRRKRQRTYGGMIH